jgi:hypothetical protein
LVGGTGYRGGVSTGDLDADDPAETTIDLAADAADGLVSIEAAPLEERAAGYDALVDRLRRELERSDPARASG